MADRVHKIAILFIDILWLFMKKIIALGLLPCFALVLSGCIATGGVTVTDIHQIHPAVLADGSTVMVGYKAPQPQWQCAQIDRSSENWGGDKFKAMVDWHGPYKMLADHAVAYANQHS